MQPFHLESITAGADCAVLRIGGEVDVYTAPQLRERVIQLLGHGARHIIADLREVEFLDSTGLGALVGSLKRLREQDGSLKLVTAADKILTIFRLTGLVHVFALHSSLPRGDRRRPALASSPGLRRPQHRGMVPRTRTAVNPAACLNIPPHQARPGNCDSRVQNVPLCAAPDDRNHHPRVEQRAVRVRLLVAVSDRRAVVGFGCEPGGGPSPLATSSTQRPGCSSARATRSGARGSANWPSMNCHIRRGPKPE